MVIVIREDKDNHDVPFSKIDERNILLTPLVNLLLN